VLPESLGEGRPNGGQELKTGCVWLSRLLRERYIQCSGSCRRRKWTQAAAYKLRTTYFGAAAPRPKVLGGADPMAGQNSTRRAFGAAVRCKSGTYSVVAAVAVEKWTQAAAYKLRTTNFTSEAPELGIAN